MYKKKSCIITISFISHSVYITGRAAHFLWLFKEFLPELKKQFIFHDHLTQQVEAWKSSIRKEFNNKNIVFIGVHARRTDYDKHLIEFSGSIPVDQRFYDKAFEIYRKRYNNKDDKVVFLAVSDDTKWIKVSFRIFTLSYTRCPIKKFSC